MRRVIFTQYLYRIFKDPFSGLTHLVGALFGLFGLFYFISVDDRHGGSVQSVSFYIFSVSIVLMYLSSAVYHLWHVSDETRRILRRIDHTMIFLLIAGTYTPYCLIALKESYGLWILGIVWTIAVLGFGIKIFWLEAPRWLSTGLYLGMGWIAMTAIIPLIEALSTGGLIGLLGGGAFYSIGAVIYAKKWPDPFPPHFGFHEIWHLFVLAGTASHFYSIATLIP